MNINLLRPWQPYINAFRGEMRYRRARRELRGDRIPSVPSRELVQRDTLIQESRIIQVSTESLLFGLSARVASDTLYRDRLVTVFEANVESVAITEADVVAVNRLAEDTSISNGVVSIGLNSPAQTARLLGLSEGIQGEIELSMIGRIGVIASSTESELNALPPLDNQSTLVKFSGQSTNSDGTSAASNVYARSLGKNLWIIAPDTDRIIRNPESRLRMQARGTEIGGRGILTVTLPANSNKPGEIGRGENEIDDALAYAQAVRKAGFAVDKVVFGSVVEKTSQGITQRDSITIVTTRIR